MRECTRAHFSLSATCMNILCNENDWKEKNFSQILGMGGGGGGDELCYCYKSY